MLQALASLPTPGTIEQLIALKQLRHVLPSEAEAHAAYHIIDATAGAARIDFKEVADCYLQISLTGYELAAEQLQHLLDTARALSMSLRAYVEGIFLPRLQDVAARRGLQELRALLKVNYTNKPLSH